MRSLLAATGLALALAFTHAPALAQSSPPSRSSSRTRPPSSGRLFSPAPAKPAKISTSTCRNSARSPSPTSMARSRSSKMPSPASPPPSSSRRRSSRRSASRSTRPPRRSSSLASTRGADSKAFTSFLTTDNVQAGRVAADGLAAAIEKEYGKPEGDRLDHLDSRRRFAGRSAPKVSRSKSQPNIPGLKLVADKFADGMATTGLNMMTDLITANPNMRGVFTSQSYHGAGRGSGDRRE